MVAVVLNKKFQETYKHGSYRTKMHQVYKIPLYRETDLNRLRWLGGLCLILGAILRSGEMPEVYDFASSIISMTCLMVVSYFEKDTVYLSVFFITLVILTAGLIGILINT